MIIHLLHHPVSAKKFVEPLVLSMRAAGWETELWVEPRPELMGFVEAIRCPKKTIWFDLSFNPFICGIRLLYLTREFRRISPKGICAHQTRGSFLPLLAAWLCGIPLRIYQNHGLPYLGYTGILRCILWLLDYLNCRLATGVLAITPVHADIMVKDGLSPRDKCAVIASGSACGVDLSEFVLSSEINIPGLRKSLGLPVNSFVLLYVGRPMARKGFNLLLSAWDKIGVNDSRLLLAGPTPQDVHGVLGYIPDSVTAFGNILELGSLYQAADAVALPSFHEGLPYSLLEGAASGKALIGTDIPGMSIIVKNGENGILVPVGNKSKLCEAILKLRGLGGDVRVYGEKSRRIVVEEFSRERYLSSHLDYISSVFSAQLLDKEGQV